MSSLSSTAFGSATIETGLSGCFSQHDVAVDIRFDATDKAAIHLVCQGTDLTFPLDRTEAESFLTRIVRAAQKPEVLGGGHCTTRYYARVKWQHLGFIAGGVEGSVDVASCELPVEDLEDLLATCKNEAICQKLKEALSKGLHRQAIEIYRVTDAFARVHADSSE